MSEHYGPVHEVSEHGHQLGVVASLEVFPAEIVVLCLRGIGREDIAQRVFLSGEILNILVSPDGPVAGSGYLVPFQVKELVRWHILRKDESVSISLEHRREDYAVENNIVLAYEVHKLGVGTLPPFLPTVRQEFLGVGDVSDRRVEPYVQNLAFRALYRNGNAPVKVARHGTWLQA